MARRWPGTGGAASRAGTGPRTAPAGVEAAAMMAAMAAMAAATAMSGSRLSRARSAIAERVHTVEPAGGMQDAHARPAHGAAVALVHVRDIAVIHLAEASTPQPRKTGSGPRPAPSKWQSRGAAPRSG